MKRFTCPIRSNWQQRCIDGGLTYHTHEHGTYWAEGVFYRFTSAQIDELEAATYALHEMCIKAAANIVDNNRWREIGVPEHIIPFIINSWDRDDFSLYGRFDLAYDGINPPKMLEYNADTPTALIEASIAQYHWQEDVKPNADQFNSIHEGLIEAFKKLPSSLVHFTGVQDNLEDNQTISYLIDCAEQAGLLHKWIPIDQIAHNTVVNDFIDVESNKVINTLFKLYPWEWLFNEEFSVHLLNSRVKFLEPAYKALMSNKGILPILWEMFPDSPYLLPAYREPGKLGKDYVKKPILSREGNNVTIVKNGITMISTDGDYGDDGFIYQGLYDIPSFDGFRPIIGSWVINHYVRGIGVREDTSLVTGNLSRFVPHVFD